MDWSPDERTHAEVLDGLARVPLAPQENGVGTGWRTQRQLVEGKGLTASLDDAGLGGNGETESGDGEFWEHGQANIVGHNANNDNGLVGKVGEVFRLLGDFGERDGGLVNFGEEKAVEDGLIW